MEPPVTDPSQPPPMANPTTDEQMPARKQGKQRKQQADQFDHLMEELKQFKESNGHTNVLASHDKSLAKFCKDARYSCKNPCEKGSI